MALRVLVVGDIMRDVVVRPEGPLRRGTDQRATVQIRPGGAGANQAIFLARAGVAVRLAACVGADDFAVESRALMEEGVEPALVPHPDRPTGTLVALVDADGERSFLTERGANDALRRSDLPAGLLANVDHLHVSGYALVGTETRETVLGLLSEVRQAGLTLSFDPGSAGFLAEVGATAVLEWMAGADLCILNRDEAAVLAGSDDPACQLERLGAVFGLVVLKCGAAPALARKRDGATWHSTPPASHVVDTTGAGDAFLAHFLAGWLSKQSIQDCLDAAVRAGASVVAHFGARPPRSPTNKS